MLQKSIRTFTTTAPESLARVRKLPGKNINVASHNEERRQPYRGSFTFGSTWGMGLEGFSHGTHLHDMNPLVGGKSEFKWLFGLLLVLPLIAAGRRSNEDGVSKSIKTTNRYARMHLDNQSAMMSTWQS